MFMSMGVLVDGYDRKKPEHHQLLISLLITACDLSDQTKDWNTVKKIAVSMAS